MTGMLTLDTGRLLRLGFDDSRAVRVSLDGFAWFHLQPE